VALEPAITVYAGKLHDRHGTRPMSQVELSSSATSPATRRGSRVDTRSAAARAPSGDLGRGRLVAGRPAPASARLDAGGAERARDKIAAQDVQRSACSRAVRRAMTGRASLGASRCTCRPAIRPASERPSRLCSSSRSATSVASRCGSSPTGSGRPGAWDALRLRARSQTGARPVPRRVAGRRSNSRRWRSLTGSPTAAPAQMPLPTERRSTPRAPTP
jgi:hypothetical protein